VSNKATKSQTMMCDICGNAGVRWRYISRSYGKGESLLVIERLLMLSCSHCGESYLTAQTLHEIERIKRSVAVAVFA
jgi:YgiT-type zinc finger domain-containing protein